MLQLPFGGVNITVLGSTKFKMNIELLPPASDVNYVVDSIFRLLLLSDIVMILHCLSKWPNIEPLILSSHSVTSGEEKGNRK